MRVYFSPTEPTGGSHSQQSQASSSIGAASLAKTVEDLSSIVTDTQTYVTGYNPKRDFLSFIAIGENDYRVKVVTSFNSFYCCPPNNLRPPEEVSKSLETSRLEEGLYVTEELLNTSQLNTSSDLAFIIQNLPAVVTFYRNEIGSHRPLIIGDVAITPCYSNKDGIKSFWVISAREAREETERKVEPYKAAVKSREDIVPFIRQSC